MALQYSSAGRLTFRIRKVETMGSSPDRGQELDSAREGVLEGFQLGSYLLLVDYTGRLFREAKAVISAEPAGILDASAATRTDRPASKNTAKAACSAGSSASRERLRKVATRLGLHHLPNPGGCPAR